MYKETKVKVDTIVALEYYISIVIIESIDIAHQRIISLCIHAARGLLLQN
jgi:hypothetical protein